MTGKLGGAPFDDVSLLMRKEKYHLFIEKEDMNAVYLANPQSDPQAAKDYWPVSCP